MQFQFEKMIGENKFIFTGTAENVKTFFQQVDFYSSLPSVGPNGEKDLHLQYRKTSGGDTYYSLVCKSAGKEFQLGQHKESETLFPKGWADLYDPNKAQGSGGGGQQASTYTPPNHTQASAPPQNSGGQQTNTYTPSAQQQASAPAQSAPATPPQGGAADVLSEFLG